MTRRRAAAIARLQSRRGFTNRSGSGSYPRESEPIIPDGAGPSAGHGIILNLRRFTLAKQTKRMQRQLPRTYPGSSGGFF